LLETKATCKTNELSPMNAVNISQINWVRN
jgi:hypothetical protein